MRGKKTDPLVLKAIRFLDGHLEPLELSQVLNLPKRTTYDLLRQVREEVAREEAARLQAQAEEQARLERERLDRQQWEAEVLSKLAREQEKLLQQPAVAGGRNRRFVS